MTFSFHVYPARGHAIGCGGTGENRGSGGTRVIREPDEEAPRPLEIVAQSERSQFIDQVLENIRRRNMLKCEPEPRREAA